MKYLVFTFFIGLITIGCQHSSWKINDKSQLIKLLIDSTIKLDEGLNSDRYWIDFSKVEYFDEKSISNLKKSKKDFDIVNSDSLLKVADFSKGELDRLLIVFERTKIEDDTMKVLISKYRGNLGAAGVFIVLTCKNELFHVVSSKITWIS